MSDGFDPVAAAAAIRAMAVDEAPRLLARVLELEAAYAAKMKETVYVANERDALRAEVERLRATEREWYDKLQAADSENERLRGALDRAARTLRGETGCEDQGQAYDTAQRIIDAALADGGKT